MIRLASFRNLHHTGIPLLLLTLGASAATAQPTPPIFVAGKLADNGDPPIIDGRVDDAVWQTVKPFTEFTQQDPTEGAPASERTEVRLIVGRGHVYVGIICFDSDPTKIIVSQARRDASLNETDSVIIVFDTFNDNQNAFVFGTNPLGIEYDGQVAREGQTSGITFQGGAGGTQRGGISAFNPNWDGDWTVKAQVTSRGWEAELAIPLKTLALLDGRGSDVGLQRPAQHPTQERAGLSGGDSARIRHLPGVDGGQGRRADFAGAAGHQAHSRTPWRR